MRARVWNMGPLDLNETFKGDVMTIKAGEYKEMEFFDAHEYKSQFAPIFSDASGRHDPKSFKIIKIEKIGDEAESHVSTHKCMSCGKSYESEPVLKAHASTEHAEQAAVEIPEVDEALKKRGRKPAA